MEGITPDRLERELIEAEESISRERARQIELIRLADQMQLPLADGCKSLREWLAGRLDVSTDTAYELATTSKRLADSPQLERQLASGEITFDRAAATSRLPVERQTPDTLAFDIAGLHRLAARLRRFDRTEENESHLSQHLTLQPNLDESRWDVWGRLDAYGGAVVNKVLTEEADLLPQPPDGHELGIGYRRAIALTQICERRWAGAVGTPLITVFVDDNGAEVEGGPSGGPGLLDRIACIGALEVIHTVDGQPLAVGRRTRVISPRLRRFILHRDGGCTADGCTSRYRLQAHHVIPWSEGGPTDPWNLVTLCWFHHQVVVHGMGYRIDASHGPGRVRFMRSSSGHDPPD